MTTYNLITDFGAVGDGSTDDAHAFVAAGDTLTGTSGNILFVPAPSVYYAVNSNFVSGTGRTMQFWTNGIKQFKMQGAGASSTKINLAVGVQFGGSGLIQNGNNYAKVATVLAGANVVLLLTPSQVSLFTVGQWVVITGLNVQDLFETPFGYPCNLRYFQYVQITAIDTNPVSSTYGQLTFASPLTNEYRSTWPEQNQGSAFEVNSGGPAGIYSLPSSWNIAAEYHDMTFDGIAAQLYANGRSILWQNCTFLGAGGPIPTQNQSWTAINCTAAGVDMEVDKLISSMVMDSCTWDQIHFQSSSVTKFAMTNSTVTTSMFGTGISSYMANVTLGIFQPGAYAYGVCDDLTMVFCSIAEWRPGGLQFNSINQIANMVDGVIQVPNGTRVSNITDNGSGLARYTVDSSAALTVGNYAPIGNAVGKATTSASSAIGSSTLTFTAVPRWIVAGQAIFGSDNGFPGISPGTTIMGTTSTTMALSNPLTAVIPSGEDLGFPCAVLSGGFGGIEQIAAIPDATHVDFNITLPLDFVYFFGANLIPVAPPTFAVPGRWCYLNGFGPELAFKVIDYTQDANFTYVKTNRKGTYPIIPPAGGGALGIQTPGVQSMYLTGCTGAAPEGAQFSQAGAQNKPEYSYFRTVYTGSNSPAANLTTALFGNLVSITIDVQVPYTGVRSGVFLHMSEFDNYPVTIEGQTAAVLTGFAVDTKVVGKRVVHPGDNASNPTAKATDGSLTTPLGCGWFNSQFSPTFEVGPTASSIADISGESSSVWPVIVVEIITDSGFPPPPPPNQTVRPQSWM